MPKAAALSLVVRPKARSFKLEYKMATKKPMKKPVKRVRRFQEGGEAALKAEGLAASNKDAPLGFFESLRRLGQGNIDQEGSEAYNRYGAGRGRMERAAASEFPSNAGNGATTRALAPVSANADAVKIANAQGAREMDEEMYQRGRRAGEVVDSADRYRDYTPIAKPAAVAQNAALLAKKATPAASRPAAASSSANATDDLRKYSRRAAVDARAKTPAPAPAAVATRAIPGASATQAATAASPERERLPEVTGMSNLEKLLVGTGLGGAAAGLAGLTLKARKAYLAGQAARAGARKRGDLKQQTIDEINQVRKTDGRPALDAGAPIKSRSDLKQKTIDEINQNRKADGRSPLADDAMKRGGRVKKMASGGSVKSSVSTASKRGDGIALRGKTRGKIY